MKGHTRKRGKKWCIVFDEGRNEDGRRIFATKEDADEALREQLQRVDQDDYIATVKQTFKEYAVGTWLPFVRRQHAPSTHET